MEFGFKGARIIGVSVAGTVGRRKGRIQKAELGAKGGCGEGIPLPPYDGSGEGARPLVGKKMNFSFEMACFGG